jgi:hypothetical protein
MITDTFVPMGPLSQKQKEFLFDNVIDAVKQNVKSKYSHIITVSADTGDGKTFTLINYILPELIRNGFVNHIYMAPDAGLVKQTRDMAHDIMSMQLIAGKPVNIIDEDLGKKYIKGKLNLPKNCINVFFITKKMFLENKKTFISGHLSNKTLGAWSVFDDEAHSQTGVPSVRDTKPSTGINNKKAKLSTFRALNAFRKEGNNIIGTSATLTNSQKGKTTDGKKVFLRLPQMTKDPLTCTFADFTTVSAIDYITEKYGYWNFSKMLSSGLALFAKHCKEIDQLHDGITDATWNVLDTTPSSKFAHVRPDIIIKVGRANATNGIRYEDCIDLITKFVNDNNFILADLVKMTFGGQKIKDMGEMIKTINTVGLDKNVVVVTKDKASVGINVPTLTHAIIARTPAQKLIHNNWSQFLGRVTRMPFFRSHQEAKDFIFSLDIHYDQKALLATYYALMNWSHSIVPQESELLASRVNADDEDDDDIDETVMDYRLKNTMNLEAGKQFLFDGLQESCTGKNSIGYTITRLTPEMSNFIKGTFCGNCKRDANGLPVCLPNVYETFCKTYGHVTLEEFLSQTNKSASVREHKDNDHFNNNPVNIAYVCATLSAFKTDIYKDWNQSYTKVNGKMIPSKLNKITV